jgi:lipopolysaccharide biosynthesis glycosyltransferase
MPQSSKEISPPVPIPPPAPLPPVCAQATTDLSQGGPANIGSSIHLLLCGNARYLQHIAVCLTSLLANNPDVFVDAVIVGRASEQLDQAKLRRSLARFSNHSVSFREFIPPADRQLPLNPRAHYTLDNWTRLWVEEFFADDVDRVLYLDGDIVVVGSIAPLWHVDLEGALFGAVDIPGSDRGVTHLGLQPEDGYFNSGVLLIDLKRWRTTRAFDAVLGYVETYPELMTRDVDQEALNGCFYRNRKRLDYKWNAISPFFREPCALPLTRAEIESVRQDARVIHFNGSLKPWSYFCDHPRKFEYEKYLRMTEWRDFVPADRTVLNRIRKRLSAILPEKTKTVLKALMRLHPGSAR